MSAYHAFQMPISAEFNGSRRRQAFYGVHSSMDRRRCLIGAYVLVMKWSATLICGLVGREVDACQALGSYISAGLRDWRPRDCNNFNIGIFHGESPPW